MEKVYTVCMIIGFVIPLMLFLMGNIFHVLNGLEEGLEGIAEGLDLHFEIGDTCISFLPLSLHSICGGLLVFGTIGKVMYSEHHLIVINIVAFTGGYFMAVLLQSLIHWLRKINHSTYSKEQLLSFEAKVVNTIIPGGFGSISVTTPDGTTRTYPAKCVDSSVRVASSARIIIVDFQKNVAFVQEIAPDDNKEFFSRDVFKEKDFLKG